MPYDLPLREQYRHRELLAGTFAALGTVGSISRTCKDVVISTASDCYLNFGTTAGANVCNSFFLPASEPTPLFCVRGSYITVKPFSGTAYVSLMGCY